MTMHGIPFSHVTGYTVVAVKTGSVATYETAEELVTDFAAGLPLDTLISEFSVVLFGQARQIRTAVLSSHLEMCQKELNRRALEALKGQKPT